MKLLILIAAVLTSLSAVAQVKSSDLVGAWKSQSNNQTSVAICSDKFFSVAVYTNSEFIGTYGGKYTAAGQNITLNFEFHTLNPEMITQQVEVAAEIKNGKLVLTQEGTEWTRLDDGKPGKLAGAWLITGRMQGNTMSEMTPGARRTMKILSGTRFQWIAYNVDTKEFFGTGGGSYTTEKGKYTENIEFFSRDNSRVGKSLSFDFNLENQQWHHKGLSSKGEPINEVWSKRENIGL
ncbi:membrane or secreted protein [Chryseosolibacter indicus]|uniref:membrane or secreted protein n=1 Tax=Chryseosolibacter indicus TaxID=2782351 RepID=UPI0020B3DAAF|nr:membrane or secreted protein [Chryseosolibacter indicus]